MLPKNIKKKLIFRKEKSQNYYKKLERLSILCTVLGITAIQLITSFWNVLPFVKVSNEERKVEQIKVSQNYEYVEHILGEPMVKEDFIFPVVNETESVIGSRAIFCSELYTLIAYFDNNMTLQGYFLISHKNTFTPRMFRNKKLINDKLSKYVDNLFSGYLTAISSSYASRRDGSSHFMKYYTHHLATNGCLIGIGVSSLGFYNDYRNFYCLANDENSFILGTPINYGKYEERFEWVNRCNINTFSIFNYEYSDSGIDVLELIKKETADRLCMTEIEHDMLTE